MARIVCAWLDKIYYPVIEKKDIGYESMHFLQALKDCGHKVTFVPLENVSEHDLIAKCKNADYLLIVPFKKEISKETLLYIRDVLKVHTIGWFGDDEHQFYNGEYWATENLAPVFSTCVTTDKNAILKYKELGIKPIYIPWGVNHKRFKPLNKKKKHIVSFIGANHSNRREMIEWLKTKNIEVFVKGAGWSMDSYVDSKKYVELFNESEINLNFSITGDGKAKQIKGRDFEVPACKGFLLTGYNPDLKKFFNLGKEIETYKTKEELLKKIVYYSSHPKEAQKIATAGYKRVLKDHTYIKRFKQLFSVV